MMSIRISKHKNTYDFLVQVRNFLLPLSLKVFRHKEWNTWSFHDDFSIRSRGPRPKASPSPKSQPSSSDAKTQLTDFFSNPQKTPRTLSVHDVIHIPRSHFLFGVSIVTSLNDTSAPRSREHLRSCLHLTNPCAKRKVLSLTKPKGKINKTKSLRHYITNKNR